MDIALKDEALLMIMYIFFVVIIQSSVLNQYTSMIYCLSKGYIQTFILVGKVT